jgi:hypothetical protein
MIRSLSLVATVAIAAGLTGACSSHVWIGGQIEYSDGGGSAQLEPFLAYTTTAADSTN